MLQAVVDLVVLTWKIFLADLAIFLVILVLAVLAVVVLVVAVLVDPGNCTLKILCILVVKITIMQFFFLIGLLFLAAAIITIIKLWQRNDVEDNTKLLWTILIVITPLLGLLCYYFFGKQNRTV